MWLVDESSAEERKMEDLEVSPEKLDDVKANVQDPLQDIHLGTAEYPRPAYISAFLTG